MSSDRPDLLPIWCAAEPQPSSVREEPPGASAGYASGQVLSARGLNWLHWSGGEWDRHFHTRILRAGDLLDTTSTVYRLSRDRMNFLVGGPLTQAPTQSGVYLWQGARLDLDKDRVGFVTFAPSTTNYVHVRPRTSLTSREVTPEILVSANLVEVGYARILTVVTGPATVSTVTEGPVTDGARVVAPFAFAESVQIDQTTGGSSALEVRYANSLAAPGVRIAPQVGATQAALQVEAPSASYAVRAVGTSSDTILYAEQAGLGRAAYFTKSGPSGIVMEAEAIGASGTAAKITASGGADGVVIDSSAGGGNPLVITPSLLGPSAPVDGALWTLAGLGAYALRFRESGADRIMHASQDGPLPQSVITTSTSTLAAGSGTTTIQTLSAFLYSGGTYKVTWSTLHGRTVGSSATAAYTCRINAVARAGANARVVFIPEGSAMSGTQFTGTWYYSEVFTWAGATGFVTVDMQITMSAGTSSCTFTNRLISIDPAYS